MFDFESLLHLFKKWEKW